MKSFRYSILATVFAKMKLRVYILVGFCLMFNFNIAQHCYPGWLYTMPVTIHHQAPAPLFQFQVKVEINTAALINAGKMQPNGSDIRFVAFSQCCKNIPYYVEAGINTPNTIIWLRTDSLPQNAPGIFIMYYGNDTASNQSNAANVFDWYEGFNFSGSVLSLECSGINASETPLAGKHTFNWQQNGVWASDSNFNFNKPLVAEAKVDTFTGNNAGLYWIKSGQKKGYGLQHDGNSFHITRTQLTDSGYCKQQVAVSGTFNPAMNKIWNIAWVNEGFQQVAMGGLPPLNTNDSLVDKNEPLKVCIGGTSNSSGTMTVDWVRVRKWIDPPPLFNVGVESVNPQPGFLGADQTICFGQLATFDASGNGLTYYSWSTSSADAAITVSTAGLYNVTSYLYNCLVFDYVSLFVNPLPNVTANANPATVCAGDLSELTVSGALSYLWFPSNSVNDTINIYPDLTSQILVTGTDSNGCSKTDTLLIKVATPELNFPDTIYGCGSVLLNAGNEGDTYLWSNSSTQQTLLVNTSGTYWVLVTDTIFGCENSDTLMVQPLPKPVTELLLPQDTFCKQNNAIALNGIPSGGIYYGDGVNGNMFVPSNALPGVDTLYYYYTDPNGCKDTAEAVVFIDICNGIEGTTETGFQIYPNPLKQHTQLFVKNFPIGGSVNVFTQQGIWCGHYTSSSIHLLPKQLSAGFYLLKIYASGNQQSTKLVITD